MKIVKDKQRSKTDDEHNEKNKRRDKYYEKYIAKINNEWKKYKKFKL